MMKPDREPDFVIGQEWWFYWDEMLQYNPLEWHTYEIKNFDDKMHICWLHPADKSWHSYAGHTDVIWDEYVRHITEKNLLRND